MSPKKCDRRSFRTIDIGTEGDKGTVCCPKGGWDKKNKECKVGTQLQKIMHKK